jgi:hypothetical protein
MTATHRVNIAAGLRKIAPATLVTAFYTTALGT